MATKPGTRIIKLANGKTKLVWVAHYRDQGGKRHQPYFDTKRERDEFLFKVRGALKKGTHTPRHGSPTVEERAAIYLEECKTVDGHRRTTLENYEWAIRCHILPVVLPELGRRVGDIRVSDLTLEVVKQYRRELLDTRSRSRPTAALAWNILGRILDHTIEDELLHQNVVRRAGRIKEIPKPKPEVGRDVWSPEEIMKLLAYVQAHESPRLLAELLVFAFTGMRIGELRGLHRSDFDLHTGVVRITRAANAWNELGLPKTEEAHREIPLPSYAVQALQAWLPCCPRPSEGPDVGTSPERRDEAARYLLHYPTAKHEQIARKVRVAVGVVGRVREALGLPPPSKSSPPKPLPAPDGPAPDLPYEQSHQLWRTSPAKAKRVAQLLVAGFSHAEIQSLAHVHSSVAQRMGRTLGIVRLHKGRPPRPEPKLLPPPENIVPFWRSTSEGEDFLVFPNSSGAVRAYQVFQRHFCDAQVKAGIVDPSGKAKYPKLHRFRHFFASLMLTQVRTPASIKELQRQLGHRHATYTLDTYGHHIVDVEGGRRRAEDAAKKIMRPGVLLTYRQQK